MWKSVIICGLVTFSLRLAGFYIRFPAGYTTKVVQPLIIAMFGVLSFTAVSLDDLWTSKIVVCGALVVGLSVARVSFSLLVGIAIVVGLLL